MAFTGISNFQHFQFLARLAKGNVSFCQKISQIAMYYVETRADNSGYTNHRSPALL
jgi:hypothetical protein